MKEKLWKAIEAYRSSGGREEHWRNRDVLDILIDEALAVNFKAAYEEWYNKTDWVQETATPGELGKHRADVLRARIEKLENELLAASIRMDNDAMILDHMIKSD